MATEGSISQTLIEQLVLDPGKSVDELLADLKLERNSAVLAECLRELSANGLAESGQRIDIARALVNSLQGVEEMSPDQHLFVADALRVSLTDREWLVRAWAAEGLGVVGAIEDASVLRTIARDVEENSWVRSDALASAFVLDRKTFVEELKANNFNIGFDFYYDAVLLMYHAILLDPDQMPSANKMQEWHINDEELVLRCLNQILIINHHDPNARGISSAKVEVERLLELNLSPVVTEYVREVITELNA